MFVNELMYKADLGEIDAADYRIIEFRASQRTDDTQKRLGAAGA